jgi:phosphoglycerate dehydrogenase-like enzyme
LWEDDRLKEVHKVVFVTDRGQRHQQRALDAAPAELDVSMLRNPDRETLLGALADAAYLISERSGEIDAALIEAAPNLRLVLRLGSLTYDIDTDAARRAGVKVCYWPLASTILVAEHVVMQMLAVIKRLREAEAVALDAGPHWGHSQRTTEDVFAFNWARLETIDGLSGKTVGIAGFGEIGVELARRLRGWECRLLYNKRRRLPDAAEADLGLTYADLETIFAESDVVANLLPYAGALDGRIGRDLIGRMKPGAFLVSSGSGGVIDEAALAAAIVEGRLAGAALDTFEWEPLPPDNPLLALAQEGHNLLLTPHVAGGGREAAARRVAAYYTNIVNAIEGRPLRYRMA